ncbi:MAG: aldehyde dehydrogenase family protein, partial [Phycisphaerales bacterium]|nr:aldehyde dehydrogenase family protein [Phycisphaerales bacterium]
MIVHDRAGKVLAHASRASRKDLREAVEAARRAQPGWAGATAYNRGQVLYRLAEMVEGKAAELAALIDACESGTPGTATEGGTGEVRACVDRLVAYAGWADKYSQVLGCNNPVAGPYYNFTVPEPTGVVCVLAPAIGLLLGLSLMTVILWLFRGVAPSRVDKWFRRLQLASAALYSLGHGANDAQKTMGIIA